MKNKHENRTFETRVMFIRDIFSEKYDRTTIMTSCVQHKLGRSYENYYNEIKHSSWRLDSRDPLAVLKRIDKYQSKEI